MKVEIHCRTRLLSPCSEIPAVELVHMAEASGYDALFLTDQGAVWPRRDLDQLREHCSQLKIFSGIELAMSGGYELIVLGADNPLYESLRSPQEVFAQACIDNYLTVLVHPSSVDHLPAVYQLADAVEIRSASHPRKEDEDALRVFADRNKMASVYASDADGLNYLNKFWIETHESFDSPQAFRRIIVGGRYENRMRPLVSTYPPSMKVSVMADLPDADFAALERVPRQESPFA